MDVGNSLTYLSLAALAAGTSRSSGSSISCRSCGCSSSLLSSSVGIFCHDYLSALLLDGLARSLAGARVGLGTLSAYRKTAAMTNTAVAAEINKTLDIHGDFTPEIAFNCVLGNFSANLINLILCEISKLNVVSKTGSLKDVGCAIAADTIDTGKRNYGMLLIRNVNASYTGHYDTPNKN